MKMSLIYMKMNMRVKLIFIWMVSHLDSFWKRGKSQLGNGLLITASSTGVSRDEREARGTTGRKNNRGELYLFRIPFLPCAPIVFSAERRLGTRQYLIDLFSLYVSLPHFRPRDGTLENHCFQILKYLRAYE